MSLTFHPGRFLIRKLARSFKLGLNKASNPFSPTSYFLQVPLSMALSTRVCPALMDQEAVLQGAHKLSSPLTWERRASKPLPLAHPGWVGGGRSPGAHFRSPAMPTSMPSPKGQEAPRTLAVLRSSDSM